MELDKNIVSDNETGDTTNKQQSLQCRPLLCIEWKKDTKVCGKSQNDADCFSNYKGVAHHQDVV
jgi:hypothetical protein